MLHLGVVCKLLHFLGGWEFEEFVTVQTQEISFYGKFVTRGDVVVKKVVF